MTDTSSPAEMQGPIAIDPSETILYDRIADLEASLTAERRMSGRLQKALDRATPVAETIERMAEAKARKIVAAALEVDDSALEVDDSASSERIADLETQLAAERRMNRRLQEAIQTDFKSALDELLKMLPVIDGLLKMLLEPTPGMIEAGKAAIPVDGEEFVETIWRAMVTELKAAR